MAESTPLHHFQTAYDRGCTRQGLAEREPALLVNADADVYALLGATISRVNRLHTLLDLAASVEDGGDTRLASALEPLAEEVKLLLESLAERIEERT
jgi:hypothetical protein